MTYGYPKTGAFQTIMFLRVQGRGLKWTKTDGFHPHKRLIVIGRMMNLMARRTGTADSLVVRGGKTSRHNRKSFILVLALGPIMTLGGEFRRRVTAFSLRRNHITIKASPLMFISPFNFSTVPAVHHAINFSPFSRRK